MTLDFNTILPYITAISIAMNAMYAWASYRRKEISALVRQSIEFYRDPDKTEDDVWAVIDKIDALMAKK